MTQENPLHRGGTKMMETSTQIRRLRLKDELLLALLPTVTVLLTLGLVEKLGRQHLLCAALASSAFLIYLDPEHQTNAVRTLVLSQTAAAVVGTAVWTILGSGYASAGIAMSAVIVLMILFNVVHPPAVTTSLAFSLRPDNNSSLALFGLAIAITVALVLLQRAVRCLVASRKAD
jgi:CBS-domain-containing membrane protein